MVSGLRLPDHSEYEVVLVGPKPGATAGDPIESSVTIFEHNGTEIGVWECTPGSWVSEKIGFGELMHFVGGHGWITDADGRWEIYPGAVKYFPDGWRGEWEVDETVRKLYVIVPS